VSSIIGHQLQPVKQGIAGRVYLKTGNNMPAPGQKINAGKPVSTLILVYELTTRDEATENGIHYTNLKTKLIAKGQSNTDGYYTIALPPGSYSVFVMDNNQLYANSFDGKGNINPVTVKKDSIVNKDIVINSRAVY
jgi:hypothetical protein